MYFCFLFQKHINFYFLHYPHNFIILLLYFAVFVLNAELIYFWFFKEVHLKYKLPPYSALLHPPRVRRRYFYCHSLEIFCYFHCNVLLTSWGVYVCISRYPDVFVCVRICVCVKIYKTISSLLIKNVYCGQITWYQFFEINVDFLYDLMFDQFLKYSILTKNVYSVFIGCYLPISSRLFYYLNLLNTY